MIDDLLDSGESSSDGSFSLAGTDNEVTRLDPKINIYHDCDDGFTVSIRASITFMVKKWPSLALDSIAVVLASISSLALFYVSFLNSSKLKN